MSKKENSFSELAIGALIRKEGFDCECGRHHAADIRFMRIGSGAISAAAEAVSALGLSRPMLICGPNSYEAAGKQVEQILRAAGIGYKLHIIPCSEHEQISPSEFAVGSAVLSFDRSCDLILGVGSGVINDICKVLSAATGRASMIIATAPSMDGYASDGASMEVNGIKLSLPEQIPSAIICDTDIMAQAPMRMLWAGLGDMFAKYTALCEWRIASLVNSEYYCPEVAELMRESLKKISSGAPGVKSRSTEAVEAISEGLVLSGIAMAFAGVSRPASGLEHYFSHAWEMMALSRGLKPELHGIQVGIGTLLTLKLYEHMMSISPSREKLENAIENFDSGRWERNIRRVFPASADGIISMEEDAGKNDPIKRRARGEKIVEHWDDIMTIIDEELPRYDELERLMRAVGMPLYPKDIGLSAQDTVDAFVCSRDIRGKYLTSSLIWDIGYMDEFAEWLRLEYL